MTRVEGRPFILTGTSGSSRKGILCRYRHIAPPGQEGWREAPGWLFLIEPEPPPRLHLRCSHPSWPGGAISTIRVILRGMRITTLLKSSVWILALAPALSAQTTPVVQLQNLAHAVESLDKTVPFYRDVIG